MPTLLKIANDLAKKFVEANDKKHATKKIIIEINCLIYTSSKQSIDDGIKTLIIQIIYELISGKRSFQLEVEELDSITPGHISIFVAASNKLLKELSANRQ